MEVFIQQVKRFKEMERKYCKQYQRRLLFHEISNKLQSSKTAQ